MKEHGFRKKSGKITINFEVLMREKYHLEVLILD
jgi:hypothetical protein